MRNSATILLLGSLLGLCLCLLLSCGGNKPRRPQQARPQTPVFSADSAYVALAAQMAFGPRVPASEAHRRCGDWMVSRLDSYGARVIEQTAEVKAFDGTLLPMRNIIASFKPEQANRMLVCAHWDCRPWCDQREGAADLPVPGANDGASGAAVMLELARVLGLHQAELRIGVDLIFFDLEDYGAPSWADRQVENDWCLGSQYWSRRPHVDPYTAQYGILLDMVGGRDAVFMWDYYSKRYAPQLLRKVWETAVGLGFGSAFISADGGAVTDDHYYVNRVAGIPCVDIIDFDDERGGFNPTWHTPDDNLDHIDRRTLGMVGQTLLELIYSE